MTTEHKNIYEAINAVMQEVGYVQKKKGGDIPYKFAGEAALIEALRPSMVEHGIVVYPAGVSEFKMERETSGKGTQYTHVHGLFSFVFQHIGSDTCVITQVVGEGIDYGDKACSKASTIAYKYALRQTFEIETGDDPDKYGSDNDYGGLKAGNGDGEYSKPKPVQAPQKPARGPAGAAPATDDTPARPMSPSALRQWFDTLYIAAGRQKCKTLITTERAQALAIEFGRLGLEKDSRMTFAVNMFGVDSFKKLPEATADAMALWLKDVKSARHEAEDFLASLQQPETSYTDGIDDRMPEPGKVA